MEKAQTLKKHKLEFVDERTGNHCSKEITGTMVENLDSVNHCTGKEITGTMVENLDSVNHCTSKEITGTMVD